MRVRCCSVMTHVKAVTMLWHGWGKGNVSAGHWGSGEKVHSNQNFALAQNNWCECILQAATSLELIWKACCVPKRKVKGTIYDETQ